LFSAEMVRAILAGRKTQTRRVVKPQPWEYPFGGPEMYQPTVIRKGFEEAGDEIYGIYGLDGEWGVRCPYGQPGDLLWVREAHRILDDPAARFADEPETPPHPDFGSYDAGVAIRRGENGERLVVDYRADGGHGRIRDRMGKPQWKPSIHMPRWACRLTLRVTDVRVERVQEISRDDSRAEGLKHANAHQIGKTYYAPGWVEDPRDAFARLWDSINAKRAPWESNPWVWVVEFERVEGAHA
jgi:hypothetical protein